MCSKFSNDFLVCFAYRDFAIRNCLVSADMTIKVGDYGLAEELFNVRNSLYYVFLKNLFYILFMVILMHKNNNFSP